MSINVAAIPSPFIHATIKRRKNTWYTIASGNWSDPNIWMSNSRRRYSSPQTGDDVSIGLGHTVTFDTANASTTNINNFYVAGAFKVLESSAIRTLSVSGDLQATGTIDLTQTGQVPTINLYGVNNYISTFIRGTRSVVNYARVNGDQAVMNLDYFSLGAVNGGTKYLTSSLTINGALSIASGAPTSIVSTLEAGTNDLTVIGTTSVAAYGYISKTGAGSLLFIGLLNYSGNNIPNTGLLLTGNPTVECRGGVTFAGTTLVSGTGTWSFTTNSQSITLFNTTYSFNGNVSVVGAITVTNVAGNGTGIMSMNAPIDCTSVSGSFVNRQTLYFSSTSSLPSFTTGTFDRTSFANTVGYTMGASITLPYTSYYSLLIGGTGVKTPSADLSLPGALTINSGGSLQMAGFDLTVTGATINSGTLSKSVSGAILFIGAVTLSANSTMDLIGIPSVEVRGGLSVGSGITYNGAITLTLTTNNQSLNPLVASSILQYNVLISGAITVTSTATNLSLVVTGTINGNNASSTLDNRITGTGSLQYQATQQPMLTGVLQTNLAANTFIYNKAGDQNITGGTYRTLTLAGSGIKTLQGNVVVATLYTLTPPATLNTNGFTRT